MSQAKPLSGIRVLEVGAYIAGPYAGSILASLGAEVVKVEPKSGDPFRRGIGTASTYFVQYNAGKRSLSVDLKSPEGVQLIKDLLPKFDVFLENSRPGKVDALGLSPEVCKRINPRLVYASTSGFGNGGPMQDRAAYDTIGQGMGGLYATMNDAGKPALTGTCLADLTTAIITTMGILAGLVQRSQNPNNEGVVVRTSLLEAMSTLTIDATTQYADERKVPSRESRHPQAQNFCAKTASGESVVVHLSSSQKFWVNFARTLELDELLEDPRFATYFDREKHYFELRSQVEAMFLTRTFKEWEQRLIEFDVPFSEVLTMETLSEHPQYQWLGMQQRDDQGHIFVQPAWRFDDARPVRDQHTPEVGEHSRAVALEVRDAEAVERLIAAGVLAQHQPKQA